MTLFVDTSVWSLALRRDAPVDAPEVEALTAALRGGESLVTTGLVLQELLQGFAGPRARKQIIERFAAHAAKAAQVQSRVKALDKIEKIEPPRKRVVVRFDFRRPPRSG